MKLDEKAKANDWPIKVEWGLIGSCTNSSYEDLSRAASIAQQAIDKNLKQKQILESIQVLNKYDIQQKVMVFLKIFEDLDATIFTNACGPCIGQWDSK